MSLSLGGVLHLQKINCGTGEVGGCTDPKGANSMSASGLGCIKALWAISFLLHDWAQKQSSL